MPKKSNSSLVLPFSLPLTKAFEVLKKKSEVSFVNVANAAAKSFIVRRFLDETPAQNLIWASADENADVLDPNLRLFATHKVFHVQKNLSAPMFYAFLDALKTKTPTIFLLEHPEEQLKTAVPDEKTLKKNTVVLKENQTLNSFELFGSLEKIGFTAGKDAFLAKGQFRRNGDSIFVHTLGKNGVIRINLFADDLETIEIWDQEEKKATKKLKKIEILPADLTKIPCGVQIPHYFDPKNTIFLQDDTDEITSLPIACPKITFTTFPPEDSDFFHLNFFSVLPYYTKPDWVTDMKERLRREFEIIIFTKREKELLNIMKDHHLMFTKDLKDKTPSTIKILTQKEDEFMPHSFQNNEQKFLLLTDRELWQFQRGNRHKKAIAGMNAELMTSLKPQDFVVHTDHGLAKYHGMVRRELLEGIEREYLELQYAGSDKLFLPVESAEKVSKYIGEENPKLTKLDSQEWTRQQKKLKKETEKIAGELLKLFASRELAKGVKHADDDAMMADFCESFAYVPTPGQASAWLDVKRDMESPNPMDRLVCGDVGFGKTEIAMRAAFKAFRSGYQCAILAPITILAEQHFASFQKRIEEKDYGVKIALMSRFQSAKEQKQILKDLETGLVDIVIGTHRLLSKDVKFKKVGLLIIDEEQRFGVKQKERLKEFRTNIDILTLTATPIPRTLHMGLNKLKQISTITTPPPGRLPVITEVRRKSPSLIRERILLEIERGGQVYFLHNQVKTIETEAAKLQQLIPEAKFIVAHGQMTPEMLEKRIKSFKKGEFDVLIASTIIENGIDLPNANTLIVNKAEKFGLSQLYQLRGRVGRGRTQAYAYFLYHGQRLELEARKRLRAIVEASELGAGFQIAMRDLEIRGAGEILGASQSGAMKSVGVGHFMRMLNTTVQKMKRGEISAEVEEEDNINVELPLSAYIPAGYIPSTDEKIKVYQELASSTTPEDLRTYKTELRNDFGALPKEVENLCKVIELKMLLRLVKLSGVNIRRWGQRKYQITLRMGKGFTPDRLFPLIEKSPRKWTITAEAIKLTLNTLPVTWYADLIADISLLNTKQKKK